MQTLTINVISPKAIKLLEDLEALDLIKVINRIGSESESKISEKLYGSITDEQAKRMNEELSQMRNEWSKNI